MSIKHYEINFIISNKVEEKDLEKVVEKVKNLITSEAGEITKQTALGRKKFAYPIEHQKHGFYQIFEFDLANENLIKLNKELKLNKGEILRFLIINKRVGLAEETPIIERRTEKIITAQKETEKELSQVKARDDKEKTSKKKISLDDLDKKLDEILDKEFIQ